jgi:hypothetical protein
MPETIVAVVGSRSFNDYALLERTLSERQIDMIVSGGAAGADSLAYQYAKEKGLPILVIFPKWNQFGRGAGFMRNKLIVDRCDKVVAFWDGESKGTKSTIELAERQGKPVEVIQYEN